MPAPMPKLRSAKPGSRPFTLELVWRDGARDTVDLTGVIFRAKVFVPLRDPDMFARVRVIDYGTAVGWDEDEGDLSYAALSLERLAAEQRPMDADAFVRWQADLRLSNRETADLLGISPSTLHTYRIGARIPKATRIACRAIAADDALMDAHYRPRLPGRPRKQAAE